MSTFKQAKITFLMAAFGGLAAISSPAMADVDLDGTFIVGPSGPIVNVKACRWHTDTLEWEVDLGDGQGFQSLENAKCDGKNVIEVGGISNSGGGNGLRELKAEQAEMRNRGSIRYTRNPIVQPLPSRRPR